MDHRVCVDALAGMGASTDSLRMVVAFLSERRMRFKVNGALSTPRVVRGGSPQGTKLGNFLFIATINKIEDCCAGPPPEIVAAGREEAEEDDSFGLRLLAGRIGAIRRFNSGVVSASTPCKKSTADGVLRYLDESGRENSTFQAASLILNDFPTHWPEIPPWLGKYVDDLNVGERLFLRNATISISTQKERREIRAIECERLFERIVTNSERSGMKVNASKTQLLCITSTKHSEVASFIDHRGERIASREHMNLLRFRFDSRPSVHAHVGFIREKFNSRVWMLRHLIGSGVPVSDVVQIYTTVIRPVIEYVSVAYHSMLCAALSDELESMQRSAMRIIFGYRTHYNVALESAGIRSLKERREEAFSKFARKTESNEVFRRWFPHRATVQYDLRRIQRLEEFTANTERLYKSPLYAMRRLLNSGPNTK